MSGYPAASELPSTGVPEDGARWFRPGLRPAAVCLLAAALAACGSPSPPRASLSPAPAPPTSSVSARAVAVPGYTVAGNRILDRAGHAVIPYGITVYGLSFRNWAVTTGSDPGEIRATSAAWKGNTVRLQVDPYAMLTQPPYDRAMMAQLDSEVRLAEDLDMNVIISAQTEHEAQGAPMPDARVLHFWQAVASRYAGDPRVWFDLFNEPRLTGMVHDRARFWRLWRGGGEGYIGMQALVDAVRLTGAHNIILVEGIFGGSSLGGLVPLTGTNLAYAVHPYFNRHETPAMWEDWARPAAKVPVVADEWNQFASSWGECFPGAPALVPKFLGYLAAHGIGLIAWTLRQPGVLVVGNDYSRPVSLLPSTPYRCEGDPVAGPPQGAGELIHELFAARSRPIGP